MVSYYKAQALGLFLRFLPLFEVVNKVDGRTLGEHVRTTLPCAMEANWMSKTPSHPLRFPLPAQLPSEWPASHVPCRNCFARVGR